MLAGLGDVGVRQIDLVDDGNDREVQLHREVDVGDRLRLHPLRGIDDQKRTLAGAQASGDLIGKIDVTGRIDEVEFISPPRSSSGRAL